MIIKEPGLYDLNEAFYHSDPCVHGSISNSGAKILLQKSPMHFRYKMDNPEPPKQAMDVGSATHKVILEKDWNAVACIPFMDWRTKAAKEQRDHARSMGKIPLLEPQFEELKQRVDAFYKNPMASALMLSGVPEKSMVWHDKQHDLWRRARADWLVIEDNVIADLKVFYTAHPNDIERFVFDRLLTMQAAWYMDGVKAIGLMDNPRFLFTVQEQEPPFPVTVVELDGDDIAKGRALINRGLSLYKRCLEANRWPGYHEGILKSKIPTWAENKADYMIEDAKNLEDRMS